MNNTKLYYDNDLLFEIIYLINHYKFDSALVKIDKYKLLYPEDSIINLYYAKILYFQEKYRDALNLALDIKDIDYHHINLKKEVYQFIGECYFSLSKYNEAIHYFETALRIGSGMTYSIKTNLSKLYALKGEKNKAYQILERRNGADEDYILDLQHAKLLVEDNEADLAINILKKIDDNIYIVREHYQKKYYYLGKAYYLKEDRINALECFKKVLMIKNYYYYKAYNLMAKIYFDFGYYDKAYKMALETNNKYDISSKHLIFNCLIKKGNIKEAKDYISTLKSNGQLLYFGILYKELRDYETSLTYLSQLSENNKYKRKEYMYYMLEDYIRLNKYQEALDLINYIKDNDYFALNYKMTINIKIIEKYVLKELNMDFEAQGYTSNQIKEYSEEKALEHIKKKHYFNSQISKFDDSVEIDELYYYFKDKIDLNNRSCDGCFDIYSFDYKNIGTINNKNIGDNITVVCLANTNKIITMYPSLKQTVVEDFLDIERKPKTKRLTQIEKFNKKYNNK